VDDELERREERELEVIRGQMDRTRASLGEKLEALESQVKDTVQVATEGVNAAVEGVKETVETVSETVSNVTDTFNVSGHIEKHPWASVGCSFATGLALGLLTGGESTPQPQQQAAPPQPAPAPAPAPLPAQAAPAPQPPAEEKPSAGSALWEAAMMGLRALGVKALSGVVKNLITDGLPREMHQELHKIVGGLTEDLGLKPEENPVPPPQPEARPEHEGQHETQMAISREEPARRHNNKPRQSASA
jgi:ElaB/YqjD/DUF883 family membrane-anchored ribosome-binding protein